MKLKIGLSVDEWMCPDGSNLLDLVYQITNPLSDFPEKFRERITRTYASPRAIPSDQDADYRPLPDDFVLPRQSMCGNGFDVLFRGVATVLAQYIRTICDNQEEVQIFKTDLVSGCSPKFRVKYYPSGEPQRNILIFSRPLTNDELRKVGEEVIKALEGSD